MADKKFTCPKKENRQAMSLRAVWRRGPRTPGWDALWRLILCNVVLQTERSTGAAREEEDGDDGQED